MKIKNILVASALLVTSYILSITSAQAAVSCQPIYGGGQSCVQTGNIQINKTVLKPGTGEVVDNLGVNDPKFGPDGIINFQITVTNTGQAPITQVNVRDIFPQFINFQAGPGGLNPSNSKELIFQVNNLQVNESRTFSVAGKVVSGNLLPDNQGIICQVNQSIATDVSTNQSSQDNAQACIQKLAIVAQLPPPAVQVFQPQTKGGIKVFPAPKVITTPPTGPEALSLLALIPTGAFGFLLRKKSKLQ